VGTNEIRYDIFYDEKLQTKQITIPPFAILSCRSKDQPLNLSPLFVNQFLVVIIDDGFKPGE
jgi:hypothetical protein